MLFVESTLGTILGSVLQSLRLRNSTSHHSLSVHRLVGEPVGKFNGSETEGKKSIDVTTREDRGFRGELT